VGDDLYTWDAASGTWKDVGVIRGPQGPAGPQGPEGPPGPQGPPGTTPAPAATPSAVPAQFGSVINVGAVTLSSGAALTFNRDGAFSGTSIDGARTALTLGSAGYWRITSSISVESLTGTPTLYALSDGADTGVSVRIAAPGTVSLDLIHSFPANAKLALAVRGGQITLTEECNAFLTATGYGA
jgi:hypothetical protein